MTEPQQVFMLLCQQWSVRHKGDGFRPDGYSLHLSDEDRQAYITRCLDHQRQEEPGATEWEEPNGTPYWVSSKAATQILVEASPFRGRRYFRNTPPPPPEAEGCWTPSKEKGQ